VAGAQVETEVVIDDGGLSGRGRMTVLRLAWWPHDPLAVALTLTAQPDHPALPRGDWVVLRDFLRYGLEEATGEGEVRIRPDHQSDRLCLDLQRPGRAACVSVPRPLIAEFLRRTEAVVPFGEERSAEAIEALLARLQASG
jgi:hypothetical protein